MSLYYGIFITVLDYDIALSDIVGVSTVGVVVRRIEAIESTTFDGDLASRSSTIITVDQELRVT